MSNLQLSAEPDQLQSRLPRLSDAVLFIVSSRSADTYARLSAIRGPLANSFGIRVDAIYLNEPVEFVSGFSTIVSQDDRPYDLSTYALIFYWPSSFDSTNQKLGSPYNGVSEFIRRCWSVVEDGLLAALPDDKVVNSYSAARLAANKFYFLQKARENNIEIPATIITNSLSSFASFRKSHSPVIFKTVCDTAEVDAELRLFPTLSPTEISQAEFAEIPYIAQVLIAADFEIRSFCLGDEVRSFRIERRDGDDAIDVRLQYNGYVGASEFECDQIMNLMIAVRQIFHLDFFSCDFLPCEDGFAALDLNPHGTWYWLEADVVSGLDQSLVNYIVKRLNKGTAIG